MLSRQRRPEEPAYDRLAALQPAGSPAPLEHGGSDPDDAADRRGDGGLARRLSRPGRTAPPAGLPAGLPFPPPTLPGGIPPPGLARGIPPPGLGVIDEVDYYNTSTEDEAAKLGVALPEPIEGQAASIEEEIGKDGKVLAGERDVTVV